MSVMFAFLALLNASAAAQQAPEVIVRAPTNVSVADAKQFVSQVTDTRQGQVARFHRPVCPIIVGLPADTGRRIAARLRANARSIGADVATEPCDANLVVIVTDDSDKTFAELRRTRESWFHEIPPLELDALAAEKAPVRSWAVISVRNEDGERINEDGDDNVPRSMRVKTASIMRRSSRLDIEGAVVMIDQAAAKGKSIGQLADYAAMRGLARTRLPEESTVSTILTLFSSKTPVPEMTMSDTSYLKELYRFSGTESLANARSRLSRSVVR